MMKTSIYWVVLLMAMTLMGSCQEEVVRDGKDIYHTWEAKSFISVESVAYEKVENHPILLTFKRDGTYGLKLDVNSCGSRFDAGKGNSIELENPACTEACCDSPFSNKLSNMLPKVTSYRIMGENLYLSVPKWGDIKLEVVE